MAEDRARWEMVADLDEALHGRTFARDAAPRDVWLGLLDEVRELIAVMDRHEGDSS